ncbi:serine/threonine-protein kinase [Streptomyces sp. NPDC001985]|uniref:serine/threonine-protein kinase n=1 Tax=Streptomyces sp. NPDC001985 TaxID=3154406 RepID=UPI003324CCBF
MGRIREIVLNRYEVLEEVGSGGQGDLYAGFDRETGEKVAIKFQKPRAFESESWYREIGKDFVQEATWGDRLSGVRGIPRILDHGHHGNRYCIVMEFAEGRLLDDVIADARPLKHLPSVASVIGQLCEILSGVHRRGLVHRDVKPENVILGPDGQVWLLDLGLAVGAGVRVEYAGGTIGYAPPEQLDASDRGLTARSDVFALGCLLLEMTIMRLPYAGRERPEPGCPVLPAEDIELIPGEFRSLALRMVDTVAENRPTVSEVRDELRPFLPVPGSPPPAKPLTPDPTEYYRCPPPAV